MILYKYYGFWSGLAALHSSKLGFRVPAHFNDPFELSFLDNAEGPGSKLDDLETKIKELKTNVAILSLTRNPLNPLMWAHYGEEHSGFVVGYKVDTPFLMSDEYNLIPVDRGDVVYTNTKTLHKLTPKTRDLLRDVYLASQGMPSKKLSKSDFENIARKLFLVKHASWVYEEEVRIVKSFLSLFESSADYSDDPLRRWNFLDKVVAPRTSVERISGLKIFEHPMEIKEVYLGVRNPLVIEHQENQWSNHIDFDRSLSDKAEESGWNIRTLKMSKGSWNLEHDESNAELLSVHGKNKALTSDISLSGDEAVYLRGKLHNVEIDTKDSIHLTNWNGEFHIQKNGEFI